MKWHLKVSLDCGWIQGKCVDYQGVSGSWFRVFLLYQLHLTHLYFLVHTVFESTFIDWLFNFLACTRHRVKLWKIKDEFYAVFSPKEFRMPKVLCYCKYLKSIISFPCCFHWGKKKSQLVVFLKISFSLEIRVLFFCHQQQKR